MKRKLRNILLAILLLGIIFVGGVYYGSQESEPEINGQLIEQQLVEAQDLVTMTYNYSNASAFENQKDFNGFKLPFTNKSFILAYDGKIDAGIDMTQVTVSIDELTQEIVIDLPEPEIFNHEINSASVEVFDESESVFNQIQVEDYANFFEQQKDEVKTEALERGLLTEAQTKSEEAVGDIVALFPQISEEYTISYQ
ncbi:DUF4230 domain-containing protein [Aerococcaceae bacterium DSM 111022]|nr:DUF4230 domain-containing protein [Aerococcaceae bacterium DSM 111022]